MNINYTIICNVTQFFIYSTNNTIYHKYFIFQN